MMKQSDWQIEKTKVQKSELLIKLKQEDFYAEFSYEKIWRMDIDLQACRLQSQVPVRGCQDWGSGWTGKISKADRGVTEGKAESLRGLGKRMNDMTR